MTISKPSGDESVFTFTLNNGAWNTLAEHFAGAAGGTLLRKIENQWDTSLPNPDAGGAGFIRLIRTTTTHPGPAGDLLKKTSYTHDTFGYSWNGGNYTGSRGNVTEHREYAYGSGVVGALVRKNAFTYLNDCPSGSYCTRNIVNHVTNAQVQDSGGAKKSETIYTYDSTSLTSATGFTHHDDTNYGTSMTTRGNPTVIKQWVSGSTYLSTTNTYDMTGQLRQVTDPKSQTASYSYSDNFFNDDGADPPAAYTPPAPTNAQLTQITLPISGSQSFGHYWGSGKRAYSQDQNGKRTYEHFTDSLDRLNHAHVPQGGTTKCAAQKVYTSGTHQNLYLAAGSTEASPGCSDCRKQQLNLDDLGRLVKSSVLNDPQGQVDADTSYDTADHIQDVSNPYRGASQGGDTFGYDGLNRIKTVTHADGQVARTFYGAEVGTNGGRTTQLCTTAGFPTLYVDEAGKKRQTWTDALGRIVEVDEPDSSGSLTLATCYSYNMLNDLTQVVQGSETRTYTYDGLARLTSETTPEAGTTNYYYTTSGGALCAGGSEAICRKTDARSITITYTYDALNRPTGKTYSNGDPTVSYFYDQTSYNGLTIANGAGRRTGMSDGSGQTAWSYDDQGRIITEKRTVGTVTKTTSYYYNIDGTLASINYPSGRTITYAYNAVGQVLSAVDSANGINYALNATYAPHGALASALHGQSGSLGGITASYTFNNRLQPATITASSSNGTALSLAYSYVSGSVNNGNVFTITNNRDTNRTQSLTYDELNRISTAESQATSGQHCWGQSFGYDRYANLLTVTVTKCTAPSLNLSVNTQNRITNPGFSYDNAGNMTSDGVSSFSWNAENRLTTTAAVTYTYDGDGRRVKKSNGKLFWYSVNGEELFETDLSGNLIAEYVYLSGRAVARRDASGTVYYFFADHLGSLRVITNATGQIQRDADFYPYGGERLVSGSVDDWHKFAGMERDPESGLDSTLFRMYANNLGRWLSADPEPCCEDNPQALDLYTYVLDNPTNLADPMGLQFAPVDDPTSGRDCPCPCPPFPPPGDGEGDGGTCTDRTFRTPLRVVWGGDLCAEAGYPSGFKWAWDCIGNADCCRTKANEASKKCDKEGREQGKYYYFRMRPTGMIMYGNCCDETRDRLAPPPPPPPPPRKNPHRPKRPRRR